MCSSPLPQYVSTNILEEFNAILIQDIRIAACILHPGMSYLPFIAPRYDINSYCEPGKESCSRIMEHHIGDSFTNPDDTGA